MSNGTKQHKAQGSNILSWIDQKLASLGGPQTEFRNRGTTEIERSESFIRTLNHITGDELSKPGEGYISNAFDSDILEAIKTKIENMDFRLEDVSLVAQNQYKLIMDPKMGRIAEQNRKNENNDLKKIFQINIIYI